MPITPAQRRTITTTLAGTPRTGQVLSQALRPLFQEGRRRPELAEFFQAYPDGSSGQSEDRGVERFLTDLANCLIRLADSSGNLDRWWAPPPRHRDNRRAWCRHYLMDSVVRRFGHALLYGGYFMEHYGTIVSREAQRILDLGQADGDRLDASREARSAAITARISDWATWWLNHYRDATMGEGPLARWLVVRSSHVFVPGGSLRSAMYNLQWRPDTTVTMSGPYERSFDVVTGGSRGLAGGQEYFRGIVANYCQGLRRLSDDIIAYVYDSPQAVTGAERNRMAVRIANWNRRNEWPGGRRPSSNSAEFRRVETAAGIFNQRDIHFNLETSSLGGGGINSTPWPGPCRRTFAPRQGGG